MTPKARAKIAGVVNKVFLSQPLLFSIKTGEKEATGRPFFVFGTLDNNNNNLTTVKE